MQLVADRVDTLLSHQDRSANSPRMQLVGGCVNTHRSHQHQSVCIRWMQLVAKEALQHSEGKSKHWTVLVERLERAEGEAL